MSVTLDVFMKKTEEQTGLIGKELRESTKQKQKLFGAIKKLTDMFNYSSLVSSS